MDGSMKIMAVVCHPADAVDHAGGTLCLHSQKGDAVTVVVCTHGVDSHDYRRSESLKKQRAAVADKKTAVRKKEAEVRKGLAILGVTDVRFLRLADDYVSVTRELVEAIATELADVQPHLLLLHNPTEELGFAHTDTAVAALKAISVANKPRAAKKPRSRSFPAQVFFMTMYGHTNQLVSEGMRHGDVLVDITSVVDRKVQAMDCLDSQYYRGDLARKCIEITNGRMGLHWCVPYAESFQTLYPGVYSHLPANDYLLHHAAAPLSQQLKRLKIMVHQVPVQNRS